MPPVDFLLFLFDLLGLCLGEGLLDLGICALAAFLHGVSMVEAIRRIARIASSFAGMT